MDDDRDINDEIDELLRAEENAHGFVAPVVAAKVRLTLDEKDPELLEAWLQLHAGQFLTDRLTYLIRSERARSRRRAGAHAFTEALEDAQAASDQTDGDEDAKVIAFTASLSSFDSFDVVDAHGTQRARRYQTKKDLLYIADQYEVTSRNARNLASFHRVLAKKVGDRMLGDVMTAEQYDETYRSIITAA